MEFINKSLKENTCQTQKIFCLAIKKNQLKHTL